MVKKLRTMRTFARTAAKSMEKKLVENAQKLRDNPYHILPEYTDNYSRRYFDKIKRDLDKVSRFHDEVKKLEKLAKKRGLDGALAGTLLIAHSQKAPYLAVARLPTGEISYAQRGRADKEKLIAVQYYTDPILRLLGIRDIAFKKGLHIYSWDKGFISTGVEAKPPKDFVDFVINKTSFSLKNGVAACKHIDRDSAKKKKFLQKPYLWILWKSSSIILAICEDCARKTKNTLFTITQYLIEPKISDDFTIEVVAEIVKDMEDKPGFETLYIDDYLAGKLTDHNLIIKNVEHHEDSIKQSEEQLLILDGVSYGKDVHRFINALNPTKYEREGLEYILELISEPLVLSNVTANKILDLYWEEHGLDVLNTILDNKKMAEKFYSLDDTPSNILELVFKYRERQEILSQLPSYTKLPPLAKFADDVAKTYKTFGRQKALGIINKRPDTPKGKSLAYAFLLAFNKAEDAKWRYTPVEIEYGEFLQEYIKKLINATPKVYHKALQELLTASGFTEDISKYKK